MRERACLENCRHRSCCCQSGPSCSSYSIRNTHSLSYALATVSYPMKVVAPDQPGAYILQTTLL
jgi:hypothetical protein